MDSASAVDRRLLADGPVAGGPAPVADAPIDEDLESIEPPGSVMPGSLTITLQIHCVPAACDDSKADMRESIAVDASSHAASERRTGDRQGSDGGIHVNLVIPEHWMHRVAEWANGYGQGRPPADKPSAERFGLTQRQWDVARLLAQGLSNAQIAHALTISPHTARRHTERVLRKLALNSRAQVATKVHGERSIAVGGHTSQFGMYSHPPSALATYRTDPSSGLPADTKEA